jgi:hypothetical protein
MWDLRGVRAITTDGDTLDGYIRWRGWYLDVPVESLLVSERSEFMPREVTLYQGIRTVMYPDSGWIVNTAPLVALGRNNTRSLTALPSEFDGYPGRKAGYGEIQQLSPYAADLLQEKPSAMCHGLTDSHSSIYWLSYIPSVTEADLEPLCRFPLIEWVVPTERTEKNGLVRFYVPWDP